MTESPGAVKSGSILLKFNLRGFGMLENIIFAAMVISKKWCLQSRVLERVAGKFRRRQRRVNWTGGFVSLNSPTPGALNQAIPIPSPIPITAAVWIIGAKIIGAIGTNPFEA
jgi:hypothetical protein